VELFPQFGEGRKTRNVQALCCHQGLKAIRNYKAVGKQNYRPLWGVGISVVKDVSSEPSSGVTGPDFSAFS